MTGQPGEWVPRLRDLDRVAVAAFCRVPPRDQTEIAVAKWSVRQGLRASGSAAPVMDVMALARAAHAGEPLPEALEDRMEQARAAADYFVWSEDLDVFTIAILAEDIVSTGTPGDLVCEGVRAGMTDDELRGVIRSGEWPDRAALAVLIALGRGDPPHTCDLHHNSWSVGG